MSSDQSVSQTHKPADAAIIASYVESP